MSMKEDIDSLKTPLRVKPPQYVRVGNLIVHVPSIRAVGLRRMKTSAALSDVFKPQLFVTYPRNVEVSTDFETVDEARAALDLITAVLIPWAQTQTQTQTQTAESNVKLSTEKSTP